MRYDYDDTLRAQHSIASANFASQAAVNLPARAKGSPNRWLETLSILGIAGLVGTAGTGTISFGDGTTANRYGTFTLKAGLAVGAPLDGTLTVTDEGSRVGTSNKAPLPNALVVTFSGTAVVTNLVLLYGYY